MRELEVEEVRIKPRSSLKGGGIFDTHLPNIPLRLSSVHVDNKPGNDTNCQGDNNSFIHDLLLVVVWRRHAPQTRLDRRVTAVTHTPSKRTALTNIEQRLIS